MFSPLSSPRSHTARRWVHLICVLFTPELTVDAEDMRANNLSALDPERCDLMCLLCRGMGGGCVQCMHGECLRAYHPFCAFVDAEARAQQYGAGRDGGGAIGAVRMEVLVDPATEDVQYAMYCPRHDPRKHSKRRSSEGGGGGWGGGGKAAATAEESPNDAQLVDSPPDADANASAGKRKRCRKNNSKKQLRARGRLSRSPLTALKGVKRGKGDARGPPQGAATATACAQTGATDAARGGQKSSRKRLKSLVDKFFADEASVSGSEGGGGGREGSDDSDGELSGDFINDGAYTQASGTDQMAMYYNVNRELQEGADHDLYAGAAGNSDAAAALSRFSFRGARDGLPLLERVLRKQQRTEARREETKGAKAVGAGRQDRCGETLAAHSRKRASDGPVDHCRGGAKRAAIAGNDEAEGDDDDAGEETEEDDDEEVENKERSGVVAAATAAAAANALKAQQLHLQQQALLQQQKQLPHQQHLGQARRPALLMAAAPALAPVPAPATGTLKAFSSFLAVDDDDEDW